MFYPVDLLSHRRRGKLAPCWLAAMTNEKLFKRYYNSNAIKKINVTETCKEILQMIQPRSSKSDRFSLYLSSQLMYGITRIHRYQIISFQKEAFEMQQKFESTALMKKKRDKLDPIEDIEFPAIELPAIELPLLDENILNSQLGPDLHILPGEDLDDRMEIAMQDAACLNFGCLNDEELNLMLKHDDNIGLMRDLQISKEKDILEKMADITITENIQKQLSQEILSPVLVDVSKEHKSKQRLSLTPQKRQPHQIQVETPTKRRRLSFETAATAVPSIHVQMATPVPELSVEEMRKLDLPQQMQTDMELELLHSNEFMINKPLKKGKVIDQKISLDDKQLRKWRQNTNIHCRQLDRPSIHNLSPILAKNLFKQPSHSSTQWNANLRNIFIGHITGPFETVNEDTIPAEFVPFPEAARVQETISKQNFPTEDSSAFGKTDTAIFAKPIDSTLNILPVTNIIHETANVSRVPEVIPDTVASEIDNVSMVGHRPNQKRISDIDESFEDIDILLKRLQRSSEKKDSPVPSTTSSQPALIKQEFLAFLNVLLSNKEIIKFSELMPKETYTSEDAATAFEILLELHAEKKIVLQQIDCSRTLRILKYRD